MGATFWQAIVTAILVLAGGVYTQRQLRKANERTADVEDKKVDALAYDRARKFDQEVVDGIKQELARAKTEIGDLRATLDKERGDHAAESAQFRKQIDALERTVDRLRRRLRDAGLDVAEEPAI